MKSFGAKYGDLRPGDLIGPYELLFPAAAGGMATVWAARLSGFRGFNQVVAIKLLADTLADDFDAKTMFIDEARTAARISHPNVGQVLDYGDVRGRPYLVMEWIEGESLSGIAVAQQALGGRLPVGWVLHVAAAACAGLHAAHETRDETGEALNVVHRDISPQNVMVTFDGFAKVVDFGVAKSRRRAQVTRFGVLKGKAGYFSPEQIARGEVDRRSDLFSFGVLLYLLTTSRHPFRGKTSMETIERIAKTEPPAPQELVPCISDELNQLILRAMAKRPEDRFQTAAELQRALERVTVISGSRVDDRQAGTMIRRLLPALSVQRRVQLVQAAAVLDGTTGPAFARTPIVDGPTDRNRATTRGTPSALAAGELRSQPDAQVGSRTPAALAIPSRRTTRRTAPHSASRGRFGGLLALGLITGAALVLRTTDQIGSPSAVRATAGLSHRARAARLAVLRLAPSLREQVTAVKEPACGVHRDIHAAALFYARVRSLQP